jgi:hypothetical protein
METEKNAQRILEAIRDEMQNGDIDSLAAALTKNDDDSSAAYELMEALHRRLV